MPVLNRTGLQLCVKKHPLWIRVLLTPQLDLSDVEVLPGGRTVRSSGVSYRTSEPCALVGRVEAERQHGCEVRCAGGGVVALAPVEYRSSVYTGYALTAITLGSPGGHPLIQPEPVASSPHPTLSLEFTSGTVVMHKCAHAAAQSFGETEK